MVWVSEQDADAPILPPGHVLPFQLQAGDATSGLNHVSALDIYSRSPHVRLTGIIATIGEACRSPAMIEKLLLAGVNIFRFDLKEGSQEYHAENLQAIRTALMNYNHRVSFKNPLAIAFDVKGPQIRTGYLEGGPSAQVELKKGDIIKLTTDKAYAEKGNANIIYIDYDNIQKVVQVGNFIYLDNGFIYMVIKAIQGSFLTCQIIVGGMLGSKKSVNLPGVVLDLPILSEKDKMDLRWAIEQDIDMVFISFVQSAQAVQDVRKALGERGRKIMIISKIENQQGVKNANEIIESSDGVIIARGDLGIEIPVEKLFLAQKSIISQCNKVGKPVVCSSQMIESMMKKSKPTRADCSDIANTILDGADCITLIAETAKGDYPLECVQTLDRICKEAEAAFWQRQFFIDMIAQVKSPVDVAQTIGLAAVEASSKCIAAAIILATTSGKSAHLIAKYRPRCPIIAVTRNVLTARRAQLYRGIIPLIYECERMENWNADVEARLNYAIDFGKARGFIRSGDPVVLISGWKQGVGFTNTMKILYVSDIVSPIAVETCEK